MPCWSGRTTVAPAGGDHLGARLDGHADHAVVSGPRRHLATSPRIRGFVTRWFVGRPRRRVVAQLVHEGRGRGAVVDDGDRLAAAGDRDVEDAALLLVVLRQPVREQAVVRGEDDDVVPLHALDPVDRRQGHARRVAGSAHRVDQPFAEHDRVGVEHGQLGQRVEVVTVAGPLGA